MSSAATKYKVEMLSIYRWKMLTSYCFFVQKKGERLYQEGLQFSCHLISGKNIKHLSLQNVNIILLSAKICERLHQEELQFSCYLITGRNVKYLWKMFTSYCFGTKISDVIPSWVAVQLPPYIS